MTKEEAMCIIEVGFDIPYCIKILRNGKYSAYYPAEIREAKEMAIRALEQEIINDKIRNDMLDLI